MTTYEHALDKQECERQEVVPATLDEVMAIDAEARARADELLELA